METKSQVWTYISYSARIGLNPSPESRNRGNISQFFLQFKQSRFPVLRANKVRVTIYIFQGGKTPTMNPTSIDLGAVTDNGVQAQLVLRSLKLLPRRPTLANPGSLGAPSGIFFCFFLPQFETIFTTENTSPSHSLVFVKQLYEI